MDMTIRPRRLRGNDTLRRMVRETRMDKSSLIYPMFVKEGNDIREEIPSMDGQYRYSVDCMGFELERLLNAGVKNVMFFGIPDQKRSLQRKWHCAESTSGSKRKIPGTVSDHGRLYVRVHITRTLRHVVRTRCGQ